MTSQTTCAAHRFSISLVSVTFYVSVSRTGRVSRLKSHFILTLVSVQILSCVSVEWYDTIRTSIDWWPLQVFETYTVCFIIRTLCSLLDVCCVFLCGSGRLLVPTRAINNHWIYQQSVCLLLENFNAIVSLFVVQKPWTIASARLWSMDNKPLDHRSIGGSIERLQLFWTNFVQCENEEAKVSACKHFQCISERHFVVCLRK